MHVIKLRAEWWKGEFELALKNNIYTIDNFITTEEATQVINLFDENNDTGRWQADSGGVLTNLIETTHPFHSIIENRLLPTASSLYGRRVTVYLHPYARKFRNNAYLDIHCDSEAEDDNGPLPAASFNTFNQYSPMLIEYAANIYLNNDYDGGELVFHKLGYTLKPKANQLIVFPSGIEYEHSVSKVSNGSRISVVVFLTTEKLIILNDMIEKSS